MSQLQLPASFVKRYRVAELIGRGATSVVFRAEQIELARPVIVKVLHLSGDVANVSRRFVREAKLLAALSHPNIVAILDHGADDDCLYLTYPDEAGVPGDKVFAEARPMPVPRAARMLADVLAGLDCAAAAGIVHRDLKPANLLFVPDGTAKLMDFGMARDVDPSSTPITQAGFFVGTPGYASPAQIEGLAPDPADDLYAAGLIAYEALIGKNPLRKGALPETFHAHLHEMPPPPHTLRPEVPPALSSLVLDLLAKKRLQRPTSREALVRAGEVLALLGLSTSQLNLPAPEPEPEPAPAPRRTRRTAPVRAVAVVPPPPPSRLKMGAAALASFLVVAVVAALVLLRRPEPAPAVSPSPSPSPTADLLRAALERFGPAQLVQSIHADLQRVGQPRWFRKVPAPQMVELRQRWSAQLAARARDCGLAPLLSGAQPLSLEDYFGLQDLEDLVRYCRKFEVPFTLPAFAERLRLQQAGLPPDPSPGAILAFASSGEPEFQEMVAPFRRPAWTAHAIPHRDRFHAGADMRDVDPAEVLQEGSADAKSFLTCANPKPFDVPADLASLAIIGVAKDLFENARFDVAIGPDLQHLTRVAVIRDCPHPTLFHHAVDPRALSGPPRYLEVRMRVLPGMDGYREYAQLPRIGLVWKPRSGQ